MRKFIMISMIALAAAGMNGCKEDEGSTLKWTNNASTNMVGVAWGTPGATDYDQTWGALTDGSTSPDKPIEVLIGKGEGLEADGSASVIDLSPAEGVISANVGGTAQIEENADARIIITAAKKK